MTAGIFTISLDFELHWGVRDKHSVESYRAHLLGVRKVVPTLLALFRDYEVHATWATVGMLFFETKVQLLAGLPEVLPAYTDKNLSPYGALDEVGENEEADPYHFAPSLIRRILDTPYQELGTHTFSHYYCLESGQDEASFRADLSCACDAARPYGVTLESIVFPRNQVNLRYLTACRDLGIVAYRGNEASCIYAPQSGVEMNQHHKRGLRLLDTYLPVTGRHCISPAMASVDAGVRNVPSTRFLRPDSPRLRPLDGLKLRRITDEMTFAARTGAVYHLWWHPHNFGADIGANGAFLRRILDHYARLRREYGMQSLNMRELAHAGAP
jgi:hypothetical protein